MAETQDTVDCDRCGRQITTDRIHTVIDEANEVIWLDVGCERCADVLETVLDMRNILTRVLEDPPRMLAVLKESLREHDRRVADEASAPEHP